MSSISLDDVVKVYRQYAPVYDRIFGGVLEPGRAALADLVRKMDPGTLLEVGVGTGLLLNRYPLQSMVFGIDISPDMLAIAKKRHRNALNPAALIVMNGEELAFSDDSFDCVTLPYVLSVTPNPERLISEVRRVCKPDGMIVLVNHFSGGAFWWGLEKLVAAFASRIGFRSSFRLDKILSHDWTIVRIDSVNLFGLSKLIQIRNSKASTV